MKKILFFGGIICSIVSCSKKLTNEKAKEVINQCFSKDKAEYIKIFEGDRLVRSYSKETLNYFKNLKELQKDGLVKFDSLSYIGGLGIYYNLHLTGDAKRYIVNSSTSKKFPDMTETFVKAIKFQVEKIESVHENPSSNTAKVKAEISIVSTSPFSILFEDSQKSVIKDLNLNKTNDGWSACE